MNNKNGKNLSALPTPDAPRTVNEGEPADGKVVNKEKQQSRGGGCPQKPRRSFGKLLNNGGQLENKKDQRIHGTHRSDAQQQFGRKAQCAWENAVKLRLEQRIISEEAKDQRSLLIGT